MGVAAGARYARHWDRSVKLLRWWRVRLAADGEEEKSDGERRSDASCNGLLVPHGA